jgi:mono/diheme cytochrome c family protein
MGSLLPSASRRSALVAMVVVVVLGQAAVFLWLRARRSTSAAPVAVASPTSDPTSAETALLPAPTSATPEAPRPVAKAASSIGSRTAGAAPSAAPGLAFRSPAFAHAAENPGGGRAAATSSGALAAAALPQPVPISAPEPVAAPAPPPAATPVAVVSPAPAPRAPDPPTRPVRSPTPRATGGGSEAAGRALVGSRCTRCHGVTARQYSRAQWEAFVGSGRHDRYEPLGDEVSAGEMASILAYLKANAADAESDQGAGVR